MKLMPLIPDEDSISASFNYDLHLGKHTRAMATFVGLEVDEGSVVFNGRDLSYRNGKLIDGIVTKITFENANGDDLGVISNLHLDLPGKIDTLPGILKLLAIALRGHDTIIGSREGDHLVGGAGSDEIVGLNGRDRIFGSTGNDVLTRNLGSDLFFFEDGHGRDIVTDFDAVGGGLDQDYLMNLTNGGYDIRSRGNDTVIDFGDGDKIVLLNVASTDVSAADIGPFILT
jgi:Ca2+-binding RTX toxin-like protein